MKVTRHDYESTIEGYIYEAGYEQKSRFKYVYELEKKILHIYDDMSYRSTGAANSVNEIVAEIDKITKDDSKGLKGIAQNFISLFSKNEPSKIIFYTEAGSHGVSGSSKYGEPLNILGYDFQNRDYTGYIKEELYHEFVDINSIVEPN
ncbi:hypothetical protein [Bacillus subtilis]|uniref:hypothetical protein n=1 Tax=Bacillus subtilis TaxID=1423 RepID=UPI00119C02C4|nr:hypothetical protein [Bacillus subtilis]TWG61317.1 hypothetical protein L607_000800001860 [Bacillus subtilis J24]TWG69189.1 hypothetical protein L605_000600000040 [Bacillus subtilis J26]